MSLDAIFAYAETTNTTKPRVARCKDDGGDSIPTVSVSVRSNDIYTQNDQFQRDVVRLIGDVATSSRARAVVVVGIPSCGGDQLVDGLVKNDDLRKCVVPMAVDDVFFNDGKYKFVGPKLLQAHTACKAKYVQLDTLSKSLAVVNNTNVHIEEIDAYAKRRFIIVRFTSEDKAKVVDLCARDTVRKLHHTVPEGIWYRMKNVPLTAYKKRFASNLKAIVDVCIV